MLICATIPRVPGDLLIRGTTPCDSRFCYDAQMRDLVILFVHVIATLARLLGPGGTRSVVAETVLVKQQLLILKRSPSGHPTYTLQIALLPVCVISSFIPPA